MNAMQLLLLQTRGDRPLKRQRPYFHVLISRVQIPLGGSMQNFSSGAMSRAPAGKCLQWTQKSTDSSSKWIGSMDSSINARLIRTNFGTVQFGSSVNGVIDVVLFSRFTLLESIAIKIDKSATEAHERNR